jgi:NADH-quinone oxidoreductase subunit E
MLSEAERQEIEAEMQRYPEKRAACIGAMKIIQRHRGWVSDDALRDIGDLMDISVAKLDGIAAFYNGILRKPVGQHVVYLCDSVSCWILGYEQIRARIEAMLGIGLGETTKDGRFTLLPPNVCLGDCGHAPVMMVDENLHHDLDPDTAGCILEEYRRQELP